MTHGRPVAASVYLDHSLGETAARIAEVHYVSSIEEGPLQARHLLFVLADDFPPMRMFTETNLIPFESAPSLPYTAQSNLTPAMPILTQLANFGVRFPSVRVSPVCSPTRATIFTGVYPFRHGVGDVVNGNATQAGDLVEFGDAPYSWSTIFHALDTAGIRTALIGKLHMSFDYEDAWNGNNGKGWSILDTICPPNTYTSTTLRNLNQSQGQLVPNGNVGSYYRYALNDTRINGSEVLKNGPLEYNTTVLTDKAIAWWNQMPDDETSRGFMYFAPNATHTPFGGSNLAKRDFPPTTLVATQEYKDYNDRENPTDNPVSYWEDQLAAAEVVDTELGRLLSSIPAHVRDKLTIVFCPDNGPDGNSLPSFSNWPPAPGFPTKNYGPDWQFLLDNGRMKGGVYHKGGGVEMVWSGPGLHSQSMPRKGSICKIAVDGPDLSQTILDYFGASFPFPRDGTSIFPAIYGVDTPDPLTWTRDQQYSETWNPNGDWHDVLATADEGLTLLRQSMWAWLKAADGFSPSGRFTLLRIRESNAWTYLLYHHYLEDGTDVDQFEKNELYASDPTTYGPHKEELERRINALLNSGVGEGGDSISVIMEDGVTIKTISTSTQAGEEQLPILMEDGFTYKFIRPTTSGTIGVPVANSGGRVIPYTTQTAEGDWRLPVAIGQTTKYIDLDLTDSLPVAESGGKTIASVPGSPNTIPVAESGGRSISLELQP